MLIVTVMLSLNACAALQPANVNDPRSNLPPYPIVASEPARLEGANLAWQQLSQRYSLPQNSAADLEALTGTLHSIPANLGGAIFLPKVGGDPPTEEDLRESLRRFIAEWQNLIGADPTQLSLIERIDNGPTIKLAHYEQRPFRYPLRGAYGNLAIRFQSDRRVIDISSTCLPNADRLQSALAALAPKVTVESAAALVKGHQIDAPDATGVRHTFTLSDNAVVEVRQLVAYVLPSQDRQRLELHLGWEIEVTNGPIKTIYLDAITEQVIAVA